MIGPDYSSSVELRQLKRAARRTGRPSPGADGLRKREFIAAGGLMGYGSSFADTYRLAGIYVARTLKGEKSLARRPLRRSASQCRCHCWPALTR